MSTAPLATPPPSVEFPPSLKRRGPACVELRATDGPPARLTASGYHLRAARRYSLRVRTPTADSSGHVQLLEAETDDALHVLTPPACVPLKDRLELTLRFKPRLVWPFPYQTVLTINSRAVAGEEPVALPVPVVVWPSLLNQVAWIITAAAPIAAARLAALSSKEGGSLLGTLVEAIQDARTWVWMLVALLGGLMVLRLIGWLRIVLDWRE
jgi:hypothetical protein